MIVTSQTKKDASPTTNDVKVILFITPKESGPPRQIIDKNIPAVTNIKTRNTLNVIYCIFFIVSMAGFAPATFSL